MPRVLCCFCALRAYPSLSSVLELLHLIPSPVRIPPPTLLQRRISKFNLHGVGVVAASVGGGVEHGRHSGKSEQHLFKGQQCRKVNKLTFDTIMQIKPGPILKQALKIINNTP